jgi:hypothetical protein
MTGPKPQGKPYLITYDGRKDRAKATSLGGPVQDATAAAKTVEDHMRSKR